MNGITYFKLESPYAGDRTKNCALTGSEVDNNFFVLEGRDVKSVVVEEGRVLVNLYNGETLATDNITENCVKSIEFDEINGILTIEKDGVTQTISGFATNYNIGNAVSVDGSLKGNGLAKSPVGISPVHKTGQYRPVKAIIKTTEGGKLPSKRYLVPGDRYITEELINDYGCLYNYDGLREIACRLQECSSEWRIPTKADWDDMLDAVEPNPDARNHTDARSNKYLGEFAGKLLKSVNYWKKEEYSDGNGGTTDDEGTCIDYQNECGCHCNNHEDDSPCAPSYYGEEGTTCHHDGHCHHNRDHSGLDKYCFSVYPAGYANESKDFMYFKERGYFWTATNHEYRDAYIKVFCYNKNTVLQDIFAADNYLSVRLVKDYDGSNYNEREDILGGTYSTVIMPSIKHGSAVWTSVNLALVDISCGCNTRYVLPNDGEGMEYTKKYYINEWTGKCWLRKELCDGESVVVTQVSANCPPEVVEKNYKEYRLVDGELVDVASLIYRDVAELIEQRIQEVENEITALDEKIDAEIARSTERDNNFEERLTAAETTIEAHTQTIENLSGRVEEAEQKVDGIDGQLIIPEGSEFDGNTGILTLKSKGGENDVEVQFGFNFGEF